MIVLIDYDAGNTCSVMNALDRLQADYRLSSDPKEIRSAQKVIFPGVGHAGAAMTSLKEKGLVDVIKGLTQPVLGICVGMQLMAERSEEGDTACLGIIPGIVSRFDPSQDYNVPHMGWNTTQTKTKDSLFDSIDDDAYFYYVHSYYLPDNKYCIATSDYDVTFAAAIRKDNFWGIQFHAEKSSKQGAQIIENFLK